MLINVNVNEILIPLSRALALMARMYVCAKDHYWRNEECDVRRVYFSELNALPLLNE